MDPNDNAILMDQFATLVKDMEIKGFVLYDSNLSIDEDGKISAISGVFIYGMFEIDLNLNFVESG